MIWLSPEDKNLLEILEQEISEDYLQKTWEQLLKFAPMPSGSPQERQAIKFLKAKLDEYNVSNQLIWYEGYVS